MRGTLSLRSRLLFGAVLWTIGFFIVASAALVFAMEFHPSFRRSPSSSHDIFTAAPGHPVRGVWPWPPGSFKCAAACRRSTTFGRVSPAFTKDATGASTGTYPSEVQPLVNDLNALLENREQAVRRAISKAGDLAHGLKTPLAILAHEAERAKAAGHMEVAAAIEQQVDRMRRQVDYHIAHARAAAAGAAPGTLCSISESTEGLARALRRSTPSEALPSTSGCRSNSRSRVQREDLDEMIGNLLDNACKWGRARVSRRCASKRQRSSKW